MGGPNSGDFAVRVTDDVIRGDVRGDVYQTGVSGTPIDLVRNAKPSPKLGFGTRPR
jgi:hypothetical protein